MIAFAVMLSEGGLVGVPSKPGFGLLGWLVLPAGVEHPYLAHTPE